ncbi:MAG: hypothetical protein AMXMBFR72_29670 [Betaproteobacteria bacterium]
MRYMMFIKATADYEAGVPPNPRLIAAMAKLAEEGARAGVLLAAEGLLPSAAGARVRYANGRCAVIDGPFAETKELVGGYAIVEAQSKQDALAHAERVVAVHAEAGVAEVEVEVRPLAGDARQAPAR